MTNGYIYCFSNQSLRDILKIGITELTPELILNQANSSNRCNLPTPYKIEFAKKVLNPKQKETTLHKLLSQYTERINPKYGFFRVSIEEVKTFFDLIDGDLWVKVPEDEEEYNLSTISKCRDARKCFTNGQRIRHNIGINKTWIGTYDSANNGIMYNGKMYKGRSPLNQFVKSHYETERNDRVSNANAWYECECEVNEKWISTFNL
jgi:hypothetical protein